ncbi:MAG: hypothetical protein D6768_01710, partial [Chloroflexi bacterium]
EGVVVDVAAATVDGSVADVTSVGDGSAVQADNISTAGKMACAALLPTRRNFIVISAPRFWVVVCFAGRVRHLGCFQNEIGSFLSRHRDAGTAGCTL